MIRFDKKALGGLEQYSHETSVPVRFQDVDAAGVVFFGRFFDYVHAAYEEFLSQAGHGLAEVIEKKEWAAPLRHAEADYFRPARFGQVLKVRLVKAHAETSEITLGWKIVTSPALEAEAVTLAVVQTVHTFVSLPQFARRDVPVGVLNALQSVLSSE